MGINKGLFTLLMSLLLAGLSAQEPTLPLSPTAPLEKLKLWIFPSHPMHLLRLTSMAVTDSLDHKELPTHYAYSNAYARRKTLSISFEIMLPEMTKAFQSEMRKVLWSVPHGIINNRVKETGLSTLLLGSEASFLFQNPVFEYDQDLFGKYNHSYVHRIYTGSTISHEDAAPAPPYGLMTVGTQPGARTNKQWQFDQPLARLVDSDIERDYTIAAGKHTLYIYVQFGIMAQNPTKAFDHLSSDSTDFEEQMDHLFFRMAAAFDLSRFEGLKYKKPSPFNLGQFSMDHGHHHNHPVYNKSMFTMGPHFHGPLMQLNGALRHSQLSRSAIAALVEQSHLKLPKHDGHGNILRGLNSHMELNQVLAWHTLIQYNNQFDNVTVNSRFQWRFRPSLEFFVSFTDHYLPLDFKSFNRSLVLLLTYWLHL